MKRGNLTKPFCDIKYDLSKTKFEISNVANSILALIRESIKLLWHLLINDGPGKAKEIYFLGLTRTRGTFCFINFSLVVDLDEWESVL